MKRTMLYVLVIFLISFSIALSGCASSVTTNAATTNAATTKAAATTNSQTGSQASSANTTAGQSGKGMNVAIVFSTLGDLNFNDWGFDGIKQAKTQFGINYDYVEAKTVSDAETQIDAFASDEKYSVIIVMGSDRQEAMESVAKRYPKQKFALIDAGVSEGLQNCVGIRADYPQWQFLTGVLAGIATKDSRFKLANQDNVLGFVGGADSPTSRAGAAGFISGAKYVNPDVKMIYTIVGSYTNPTAAKEIALTMIGQKADIISVNCGSSANGVKLAAEEKGIFFCSTSNGLISKSNQLAVSITRFDTFVVKAVEMVINNNWKPGTHIYGIKDGACKISFEGFDIQIPDDVMKILKDVEQQIVDGKIEFVNDPNKVDEWAKKYQYKK